MKVKIPAGKTLPIGVDIGTSCVKLAQLRVAEDTFDLLAAASVPIPRACHDNQSEYFRFLSDSIRNTLSSEAFKGRQCILSLPAKETFVRHIKLPNLRPEEIPQALVGEFTGKLPYPVENAILRHVIAGEIYDDGETKQEVIVVATHRQTAESYLAMARRAKLEVVALNIESCAIIECFSRLFNRAADSARTTLFVDLGAASTQAVLAHGNRIAFARNLKRGSQQLDNAFAKQVHMPPEEAYQLRQKLMSRFIDPQAEEELPITQDELYSMLGEELDALADELTQCLRYYESVFRNRNIERAIFVGGQARDRRLCQAIAQRLNLPAQIGDPLLRFGCVEGAGATMGLQRNEPCPALAVAVGLSLGTSRAA
ncbi:MAG: type IV pilus assembly protein PilM [Phycisphaerae bacterium]|nr:type IV pilus assembly protein PilM [Phycisphaerae bacterium]